MTTPRRKREIDMRVSALHYETPATHLLGLWHELRDEEESEVAKKIKVAVDEEPEGAE